MYVCAWHVRDMFECHYVQLAVEVVSVALSPSLSPCHGIYAIFISIHIFLMKCIGSGSFPSNMHTFLHTCVDTYVIGCSQHQHQYQQHNSQVLA